MVGQTSGFPHTNERKKSTPVSICKQLVFEVHFVGFPPTSFLAVLICGPLKNLSLFSYNWQWRDISPIVFDGCQTFRNLCEIFERARLCVVWYICVCVDWGGGYFERWMWNVVWITALFMRRTDCRCLSKHFRYILLIW